MKIETFTFIGLPEEKKPSMSTNRWLVRQVGVPNWSIVRGDCDYDAIVRYCSAKRLAVCTGEIVNIGVIDEIY